MTRFSRDVMSLVHLFLLVMSLGGCSNAERVSSSDTAKKFVVSLNQKDMVTLARLSAIPLRVRQQEWKSAPDGTGFILDKVRDLNLNDHAQIKKYFSDPGNRIAVESEVPDEISLSLMQDELKGIEKQWAGLSLHIFRRGMGDVEHIFVVGIDAAGKVAAVYLN